MQFLYFSLVCVTCKTAKVYLPTSIFACLYVCRMRASVQIRIYIHDTDTCAKRVKCLQLPASFIYLYSIKCLYVTDRCMCVNNFVCMHKNMHLFLYIHVYNCVFTHTKPDLCLNMHANSNTHIVYVSSTEQVPPIITTFVQNPRAWEERGDPGRFNEPGILLQSLE